MCAYSFVADWGYEKLTFPVQPIVIPHTVFPSITYPPIAPVEYVPSEEWKKQFLKDLMDLLGKAKKYDDDNGEPNCELESKKEKLKAIADELGVEITFP